MTDHLTRDLQHSLYLADMDHADELRGGPLRFSITRFFKSLKSRLSRSEHPRVSVRLAGARAKVRV